MMENTILIFIFFILVTSNCLPQQSVNKPLNDSEFKPSNKILLNVLNLSQQKTTAQAIQREDIKKETFSNKVDKTEFSSINEETKSENVHVEVKTNLTGVTNTINVDSTKELSVQEQYGVIAHDIEKSDAEVKLSTGAEWNDDKFMSESKWDSNIYDSDDDAIVIDDVEDIIDLDFGYNDWIENHNKSDAKGNEDIETSSVEKYFLEDVELKDEKSYSKDVEENTKISAIKPKEITVNPRILVYESSTLDFPLSRMTVFNNTEERNDHSLLKRFARRACRKCFLCPFPKYLDHSKLHCKTVRGSMKCLQVCVFGYTLKSGTKKIYKCDLKKGGWGPDEKITDCKPFIDCSIKLKPGGKMKCYTNYLDQGNKCYVKCKGYGDKETVETKKYTCNIKGKWEPKLPHCASPGTGKKVVPRPKDGELRPPKTRIPITGRRCCGKSRH